MYIDLHVYHTKMRKRLKILDSAREMNSPGVSLKLMRMHVHVCGKVRHIIISIINTFS